MIAQRDPLPAPIVDVLVERGDRDVLHAIANNSGANFSESALNSLISRSTGDDVLALALGTRSDLPFPLFQKLFFSASELVRSKFLASDLFVRSEFSCAEPQFVFIGDGTVVAA